MSNRHLYWLAGVLTALGLVLFAYKTLILGFPVTPDRLATAWRIEARLGFTALGRPVAAEFMVPKSSPARPVFNESFVSGGYGVTTRSVGDNRIAIFSIDTALGDQTLYYRATVELTRAAEEPRPEPEPQLRRVAMSEAELAAATAILRKVRPRSAGIPTMMGLLITTLRQARPLDEPTMLLGGDHSNRNIVDTAVKILQQGGIPARRVNGLELDEDRRQAPLSHWIEVYVEDRWLPFQASDGAPGTPPDYIAIWRGNVPALSLSGATRPRVTFAVSKAHQFALRSTLQRGRAANWATVDFSLFGLPFQTQQVYRILLVVPVAIFLLVILRNVVGIRSFGTFMPVLIAMAFRETHLLWGVILFSIVVFVGMSVRFYLEQLKLLLVPRLAVVVMVVIAVMATLSVLSFKLGLERGLSVALFPIVILTMTIERMAVVWDERGAQEALTQAMGSLSIAVLCYFLMNARIVEHLVFVFPELLMLVLAATLLMGRYSGYRLVELTRFKVLARGGGP